MGIHISLDLKILINNYNFKCCNGQIIKKENNIASSSIQEYVVIPTERMNDSHDFSYDYENSNNIQVINSQGNENDESISLSSSNSEGNKVVQTLGDDVQSQHPSQIIIQTTHHQKIYSEEELKMVINNIIYKMCIKLIKTFNFLFHFRFSYTLIMR